MIKHDQVEIGSAVSVLFIDNHCDYHKGKVVYHLPLAHFPPMFLTHLPPVDEPFTPYV